MKCLIYFCFYILFSFHWLFPRFLFIYFYISTSLFISFSSFSSYSLFFFCTFSNKILNSFLAFKSPSFCLSFLPSLLLLPPLSPTTASDSSSPYRLLLLSCYSFSYLPRHNLLLNYFSYICEFPLPVALRTPVQNIRLFHIHPNHKLFSSISYTLILIMLLILSFSVFLLPRSSTLTHIEISSIYFYYTIHLHIPYNCVQIFYQIFMSLNSIHQNNYHSLFFHNSLTFPLF